jgi:hypothetical protein
VQCRVELIASGKDQIVTAYMEHKSRGKVAKATVLYSHGNAVDLAQMMPLYRCAAASAAPAAAAAHSHGRFIQQIGPGTSPPQPRASPAPCKPTPHAPPLHDLPPRRCRPHPPTHTHTHTHTHHARSELCKLLNVSILAYDYTGYGRSSGKPSVAASCADVEAVYRYAVEVLQLAPASIVLYGQSVGSGPTVRSRRCSRRGASRGCLLLHVQRQLLPHGPGRRALCRRRLAAPLATRTPPAGPPARSRR